MGAPRVQRWSSLFLRLRIAAILLVAVPGYSVIRAAAGGLPQSQPSAGPAAQSNALSPGMLAQIEAMEREKAARSGVQRKLDSQLIYELKSWRGEPIANGIWSLSTSLSYVPDGRVAVDLRAAVSDALLQNLRNLGAEIVDSNATHGTIQIVVDLYSIELIASLPEVMFVTPKAQAITSRFDTASRGDANATGDKAASGSIRKRMDRARLAEAVQSALASQPFVTSGVGSVTSEGDATHGAATARATFHVDGTGVKIGVLSDGVTSLALSQARGDLGAVTVLPGQTGSGDEGTAMLEIIHDLAPGAQLYFATANPSSTTFAQNIRNLRAAGCDIIVDDIYYFGESPFQDGQSPSVISVTNGGVIAQAVKDVTATGALYFLPQGIPAIWTRVPQAPGKEISLMVALSTAAGAFTALVLRPMTS